MELAQRNPTWIVALLGSFIVAVGLFVSGSKYMSQTAHGACSSGAYSCFGNYTCIGLPAVDLMHVTAHAVLILFAGDADQFAALSLAHNRLLVQFHALQHAAKSMSGQKQAGSV